jgi:antitoxin HicB
MAIQTRNKDYYMSQQYKIETWFDQEDQVWYIQIPALKGCRSDGETIAEAFDMIEDAKEGWIEMAIEQGVPIPDSDIPTTEN